ncbi:hypothetical protein HanLR1_Chr02g0054621 [Helianthus annuus]|nr:hypothetical protein HanHA89_Chr02g0057001 [Helianthus annuus]KAJ0777197.1 hypothetical protein HanLR1_Chr02g0054621 [Helianthus annuus]
MSDPSTASSQAKTRYQKAEHAPCPADTGACSGVCRKDKSIEASIPQQGGVPSSTRPWSTLRFAESKQILIVQIRFCTRGHAQWTRGRGQLMQTNCN